jgi:YD repeat-containing protein
MESAMTIRQSIERGDAMKKYFLIYLVFILFFVVVSAVTVFAYETVYTYDNLNRLTSATYNDGTGSKTFIYRYDAAGNMTRRSITDTSTNLLNIVVVNPNPNSLNANYTLTGPNGYVLAGTGDQTINDLAPGDYTITWGSVAEWVIPSSETITLLANGSVTFTGTYQLIPIVPSPPTTGAVGSDITLNGTHFGATQGSGYVDFNEIHGTIVSWSDTQIVASVPPGATSGCLKIVTDYGASGCINFTVIAEALYAQYSGNGIWQYTDNVWTQLTPHNPEAMAAAGSLLYGKYDNGIWLYNGSTWSQLTPYSPTAMAATGSLLYGKYDNGIWLYNGSAWSQLTPYSPTAMVATGSLLYGKYDNGIWLYNGSAWNQVTASNPENMVASGSFLYGDFGSAGIWQYDGFTWTQITPNDPASMTGN